VIYLEEQIRRHETAQVDENIRLQTLARKLDLENQKMKKALVKSCGFLETEIDESDEGTLVEKMRKISDLVSEHSFELSVESLGSNLSTESTGITGDDASFYTLSATPFQNFSSTATSIQGQHPLTPPTTMFDNIPPSFTLTVAPSDVLSNGTYKAGPQRLSDLLQLVPSDRATNLSTVTCYISYELLKELVEERGLDSRISDSGQVQEEVEEQLSNVADMLD